MASSEFLFCFQCQTPVGAASIEGGSLLKVGSYCNFVTLHAVFVGGQPGCLASFSPRMYFEQLTVLVSCFYSSEKLLDRLVSIRTFLDFLVFILLGHLQLILIIESTFDLFCSIIENKETFPISFVHGKRKGNTQIHWNSHNSYSLRKRNTHHNANSPRLRVSTTAKQVRILTQTPLVASQHKLLQAMEDFADSTQCCGL